MDKNDDGLTLAAENVYTVHALGRGTVSWRILENHIQMRTGPVPQVSKNGVTDASDLAVCHEAGQHAPSQLWTFRFG